jgi:hypothetical protein
MMFLLIAGIGSLALPAGSFALSSLGGEKVDSRGELFLSQVRGLLEVDGFDPVVARVA